MTDDPIIAVVKADIKPVTPKARAGRFADRAVMPLFVAAVLFALAVGAWFSFIRVEPFDPLTLSVQTVQTVDDDGLVVIPTIPGYEAPAVYVGDPVPVRGAVDVASDEPIDVLGSLTWVQTQPGGFTCNVFVDVPDVLEPGKSVNTFDNPMPSCVQDRVELSGPSMWKISGSIRVTNPGGQTSTFTTEGFWIAPR